MRRPGTPGPRGGGVFVTEVQRARLLDATVAVVSELGYKQMTVRRVSGRAGVSNKTFYDLFEDREDCFLAAFDRAVERLAAVVVAAWEGEKEWAARVRAGLGAYRQVADAAGIADQGQISKLLARLEGHGLVANTGGYTQGVPNAWQLTPHGEEIVRASSPNCTPIPTKETR